MDGPWLCIGDFNAFLHELEKQSKRLAQTAQADAFREALELCQLEDLGYRGYPFTWSNKRPGDSNTKIHLDRAVASKEWKEKYQLSTVTHLYSHASDHVPIVLQNQSYHRQRQRRERPFKFEESWLMWEECEVVVSEAWHANGNNEVGLASVREKIQSCDSELMAWGTSKADPNDEEIKKFQKQLENLTEAETTEGTKAEYLEVSKRLDDLLLKQESY